MVTQRPSVDVITGLIKATYRAVFPLPVPRRQIQGRFSDTEGEKLLEKEICSFIQQGAQNPSVSRVPLSIMTKSLP